MGYRPIARRSRGFSLLEMMLVVVIIGMLATVVVISITGQGERARIQTTVGTLNQVQTAVTSYQVTTGSYPATLQVLVPQYLQRVPQDAWKSDLYYRIGNSVEGRGFQLISAGPDKEFGTPDDIDVWTMENAGQ